VVERHAEEVLYTNNETAATPSELLIHKEMQARIASVLEKLPERCGQIFCLSRFEGLKYAEIAERLAVSVKTVEANMGRALKEFRKEFSE
jgi:RNA polymerase sigma-70 factor (ECF subfamily)